MNAATLQGFRELAGCFVESVTFDPQSPAERICTDGAFSIYKQSGRYWLWNARRTLACEIPKPLRKLNGREKMAVAVYGSTEAYLAENAE